MISLCAFISFTLHALSFDVFIILVLKRAASPLISFSFSSHSQAHKWDKCREVERVDGEGVCARVSHFLQLLFSVNLVSMQRKFSHCSESFGDYNVGKRSLIRIAFMREYRIYLNEIRCCCLTNPEDFCKSISNGTKTFENGGLQTGDKQKWFLRIVCEPKRIDRVVRLCIKKKLSNRIPNAYYSIDTADIHVLYTTCIIYCVRAH